jgi:small GTP-binding protein
MYKKEIRFKVIVAGHPGAGTSSLVRRLDEGTTFSEAVVEDAKSQAQPKVDIVEKAFTLSGGRRIVLEVWDAPGGTVTKGVPTMLFRESVGVILVYDSTSFESFEGVCTLEEKCERALEGSCPATYFLAANKCDLPDADTDSGEEKASGRKYTFFKVSAYTGEGVHDLFQAMADELYRKYTSKEISTKPHSREVDEDVIKVGTPKETKLPEKSSCC